MERCFWVYSERALIIVKHGKRPIGDKEKEKTHCHLRNKEIKAKY